MGRLLEAASLQPAGYVTVRLLDGRDSLVTGMLSGADGTFRLTGIRSGDYSLHIKGVGYRDTVIALKSLQSDLDIGTVRLKAREQVLSSVQVTAQKAVIRQQADRIAYDLDADPESKSLSLLDMMRKVPYLSVDAGDQVLLKGSASYRIFINGKPSGLVENNPTAVLRSIPASTVKSIEVITNPPAKYDAEGLAGIINIITRKQAADGYNGSFNLSEQTPVGGPGAGANLSIKAGKLGVSALFGGSRNDQPLTSSLLGRTSGSDHLQESGSNQGHTITGYAGTELSYEPDSLHLLDVQVNWNSSRLSNTALQQTDLLNGGSPEQAYLLNSSKAQDRSAVDAGLNYQIGFATNKNELLTFSYRYYHTGSYLSNDQGASTLLNTSLLPYRQQNQEQLTEQTLQADFVRPLGKVSMETGLKGIFRSNDSRSDYQQADHAGVFEPVPAFADFFLNRQNVYAAYNSYSWQNEGWQVNGGLRLEATDSRSASVVQDYLTLAPSFALRRKLNATDGLTLSYVRRIQRPSIAQLNPFVDRSDQQVELSGDPALHPTTTHILQVAYFSSRKATWNIALGYMFFNSVIGQVTSYDDSTHVSRNSYENTGAGRVLKLNIYVNYPLTSVWSAALNADLRQVSFAAPVDGVVFDQRGAMAYVNVSTSYKFGHGWRLNADLTANTSGINGPQSRSNGYTASSFSINKALPGDRLNLSARVSNPWQKFRQINNELTGPDFMEQSNTRVYFRTLSVNLSYRFGKLKGDVKKSQHGIKNDDLQ